MDLISLITAGALILLIFSLCFWVIKRRFIDKRYFGSGTQFVSRHVYTQYESEGTRKAVDHIHYMEEDERDEDHGGEGDNTRNDK